MTQSISTEDVMQLGYFDLFSLLGASPLHPGGFNTTEEVFQNVKLTRQSKIIEIGCGTGFTTLNLLSSGFNVTACDVNENMVNATKLSAAQNGFPYFSPVCSSATDLPFGDHEFDLALLENTFGFIDDAAGSVSEISRVLARSGYLGIVDMHYTTDPPRYIKEGLCSVFGYSIPAYMKSDWLNLFNHLDLIYWNDHNLENFNKVDRIKLKKYLTETWHIDFKSDLVEIAEVISDRIDGFEGIFNENRKYLKCHVAVWKKSQLRNF